ncbi:MAG: Fe-S cluster assembly protein SufD [Gammaproteobacteria bacterium]
MSAAETWLASFRAQAAGLPGAGLPWLDRVRSQAIERFAAEGWPSGRLEAWRHTSLLFLNNESFAPAPAGGVDDAAIRKAVAALRAAGSGAAGPGSDAGASADGGHWLVFVDGRHAPALSQVGSLPAGARIEPLSAALARKADSLESLFGDASQGGSPAALNAALATDGAYVELAAGVALEAPVHLVFVAGPAGSSAQVRNLVRAGANAQATIVEHYIASSADAATLTNAVTRVEADADARITHVKLQQESERAIHLASIDASQARGARFESHSMSFGARLARHDIVTRFGGEGCETLLNGLYHVDGKRHVDHHTRIDHLSPRGTSHEYYRGILDGEARGVFSGRIVVAPGAVRTDAMQRADNLLLSPRAEADARPELEIYADDVKCSHGATVGQIDEASLFYLRTRGIDEAHARNLLTWAFAAEVLARIELAPLRERATQAIRSRLPGGELLETMA